MGSTISNAFKLLSGATLMDAISCFSAFCSRNLYGFLSLFAIGELLIFATQTGSGKTHTMLGDIEGGTRRHSVNCGMTPRVFEHLFSRIQKEKELRRDEFGGPNMNNCNISEDITTTAVRAALNQSAFRIPTSEIQNNLQTQPNGVAVGVALLEVQNLNLKHHRQKSFPVLSGRNKKHGMKESADASNCMGPKYTSNSINRNQ